MGPSKHPYLLGGLLGLLPPSSLDLKRACASSSPCSAWETSIPEAAELPAEDLVRGLKYYTPQLLTLAEDRATEHRHTASGFPKRAPNNYEGVRFYPTFYPLLQGRLNQTGKQMPSLLLAAL